MPSLEFPEPRVHRTVALPVSIFDKLKALQRLHELRTNGETLTFLLLKAETAGWLADAPKWGGDWQSKLPGKLRK